ncbi:MAG: cell division protein FtsX [Bdellovibrionota bacterium]
MIEEKFQKSNEKFTLGLKDIWKDLEKKFTITKKEKFLYWVMQSVEIAKKTPVIFLMAILTISFTLFIFSSYLMLVNNLDNFLSSSHSNLQVSIYLKDRIKGKELVKLKSDISAIKDVERIEYLSKKDAMIYFKEIMPENSAILDGLGDINPLPASLEVYLKSKSDTKHFLVALKKMLKGNRNIEEIQYDLGYASKILDVLKEFRIISILGFILILIVSGFIISSTIRLSLWAQQREIEVMKLVGADYNQLRMPYIINGGTQGLLGGVLAIFILSFVSTVIKNVVLKSDFLVWVEKSISFLTFLDCVLILFLGLLIGMLASFFTVRNFDEV